MTVRLASTRKNNTGLNQQSGFGIPSMLWVNLTQSKQARSVLTEFNNHFQVQALDSRFINNRELPAGHFDALVFELDYPDYDSLNIIITLRAKHPELPIIFITLEHSASLALWALRHRLWDYHYKPLDDRQIQLIQMNLLAQMKESENRHAGPYDLPLTHCDVNISSIIKNENSACCASITQAINHIEKNYNKKISDTETAILCGVTRFQLRRLFQKNFKKTFQEYLLSFRIDKAKEILKNPHAQITKTSYDVGFNDPSYFTRIFKRTVGIPPSTYRANCSSQINTPMNPPEESKPGNLRQTQ
jgi:AraC-like DNA-binding protein/CheY-like chemotaxis protein